jgi:hypothetical protein
MTRSRWLTAGLAAGAGALAAFAMMPAIAGSAQAAQTGGCTATAQINSQWGSGSSGGEILGITVKNTSPTAATTWTATWTLGAGQTVVSAWSATVGVSAGTVTAVNMPYNGNLGPGVSTTFGLQLTGTAPAPVVTCTNNAVPASSPPASSTPPGADVTVGQADTQSTVTLQVGKTLGVSLPAMYKPLTVSGSALSLVSTSGGYPTGQPLAALFRAVSAGTVTLSTQSDDPCNHVTPPCPGPIAFWTIRVNVVGASASASTGGQADVTVGQADTQSTIYLAVGKTLGVSLPSAYKPLTVSGSALNLVSTSGGYPTGQPLAALFRAMSSGTVTLSTQTDDPCFHTTPPCARPVANWTITVILLYPPPAGSLVTVTTANNNATVSLHVGDTLLVSLPAMYQPPKVATAGVLQPDGITGGYPTGQPLQARYLAVAPGQTTVSTVTDAACIHQATPCPSPQVPWTLHVTVTN